MADFDPCECVFSHDAAMRRLLSLLRNSQGYCTDSECVQDFPGPQNADGAFGMGNNTLFMIMMMWVALALALFFLRPKALRAPPANDKPGPSNARDHTDEPPPNPPVH